MAKDKGTMVSIRLPATTLARISTEIAEAKSGRLKANPTISEFVRAAIEEKLQRSYANRARGMRQGIRCYRCGKRVTRDEISVTTTDLFGVEEGVCMRCDLGS